MSASSTIEWLRRPVDVGDEGDAAGVVLVRAVVQALRCGRTVEVRARSMRHVEAPSSGQCRRRESSGA